AWTTGQRPARRARHPPLVPQYRWSFGLARQGYTTAQTSRTHRNQSRRCWTEGHQASRITVLTGSKLATHTTGLQAGFRVLAKYLPLPYPTANRRMPKARPEL